MEVTTDDETYIDDYDEWERLSDFAEDITSDSSDSDWQQNRTFNFVYK